MPGRAGNPYVGGVTTGVQDETICLIDNPCDENGFVTQIDVCFFVNVATEFKVGCGSWDGSTFTPRNFVTIDVDGIGAGCHTFTSAGGDFTPFYMAKGDLVYFFNNISGFLRVEADDDQPTQRYAYQLGDRMSDASFATQTSIDLFYQCEFTGVWPHVKGVATDIFAGWDFTSGWTEGSNTTIIDSDT